ncbi:hypothetical protein AKJ16_DCAP15995 [Drosera capensis]
MNRTFSQRRNVKENLCSYPPTRLVSSPYAAAAADSSPSIQPPHPPSISLSRRLPLILLRLHSSSRHNHLFVTQLHRLIRPAYLICRINPLLVNKYFDSSKLGSRGGHRT